MVNQAAFVQARRLVSQRQVHDIAAEVHAFGEVAEYCGPPFAYRFQIVQAAENEGLLQLGLRNTNARVSGQFKFVVKLRGGL